MPDVSPLGAVTQLSNNPPNTQVVDAVGLNAIHNALQGKLDAAIAALDDLDAANFSTALQQLLGLNSGSQVGRKFVYHPGTGSRSSTSFGDLNDAADVATGVYVPAGAIVQLRYGARIREIGTPGQAQVAIFVGSDQLKVPAQFNPGVGPTRATQEARTIDNTSSFVDMLVSSFPLGLCCSDVSGGADAADVTTGQVVGAIEEPFGATYIRWGTNGGNIHAVNFGDSRGGVCEFMVDPANPVTVDIGVKYKMGDGTQIQASGRKLWVEVIGF